MIKENKRTNTSTPKMSIAHAANFLGISVQGVHKQLKHKGLACPKIGNKSYITHETAKQLFNISFDKKVIVSQIVKGGTGKTTTIENISCCVNSYGARILKIDTDPQGNLTDASGIDAESLPVLIDIVKGDARIEESIVKIDEGIYLLPSRIENVILDNVLINEKMPLHTFYSDLLESISDQFDFIFIDCPPTMGQAVAAASLYADLILAPLNPDKFSAKGLKILRQEIEALNKKFKRNIGYKLFLNKFSNKTILSDKAIVSLISDPELEGKMLSTTIQFAQEIPNTTDANRSLFSNLKASSTRDDFDRLTRELLGIEPSHIYKEKNMELNTEIEPSIAD